MQHPATGPAALIGYIAAITAANWLTAHHGLVDVGLGLTVTAGTIPAGIALLVRDAVQDALGRGWAYAGIAAGSLLTLAISPALAVASAAAFTLAELADMRVYTRLRSRGWGKAALASGAVGAVVDTLLFLWIASLPITMASVGGQLVAKILWATLLPVAAVLTVRRWRRALSGDPIGA